MNAIEIIFLVTGSIGIFSPLILFIGQFFANGKESAFLSFPIFLKIIAAILAIPAIFFEAFIFEVMSGRDIYTRYSILFAINAIAVFFIYKYIKYKNKKAKI